ncbi:hypothetical protein LguiB_028461 [Lonicera macranthoides]
MAERKEALEITLQKVERAMEGKLGIEKELRTWRAKCEQHEKLPKFAYSIALCYVILTGKYWVNLFKEWERTQMKGLKRKNDPRSLS